MANFPGDLVRDQRDWDRVYHQLAICHPTERTELRRRLLRLSCRSAYHPHWTGRRSTAGWAELRHHARHEGTGAPARSR